MQRGKGDHSGFPATELEVRLVGLDLRSNKSGESTNSLLVVLRGIAFS